VPERQGERTADAVLDEYLVVRCQLGDAQALGHLVRRWQHRIVRHAHHYTNDPEAAQDVAQESWMAIVRGLRSLRDPARFPAWALRIVANKSRDWVRREGARRRAVGRVDADDPPAPDDARAAAVARVRAALSELEPGRRALLRSFYLEGMSVARIAEDLGIPEGTVKSRLSNARAALRARLEET
jgi:RNA polymerase sigma-70 factor (ECF subfamily)